MFAVLAILFGIFLAIGAGIVYSVVHYVPSNPVQTIEKPIAVVEPPPKAKEEAPEVFELSKEAFDIVIVAGGRSAHNATGTDVDATDDRVSQLILGGGPNPSADATKRAGTSAVLINNKMLDAPGGCIGYNVARKVAGGERKVIVVDAAWDDSSLYNDWQDGQPAFERLAQGVELLLAANTSSQLHSFIWIHEEPNVSQTQEEETKYLDSFKTTVESIRTRFSVNMPVIPVLTRWNQLPLPYRLVYFNVPFSSAASAEVADVSMDATEFTLQQMDDLAQFLVDNTIPLALLNDFDAAPSAPTNIQIQIIEPNPVELPGTFVAYVTWTLATSGHVDSYHVVVNVPEVIMMSWDNEFTAIDLNLQNNTKTTLAANVESGSLYQISITSNNTKASLNSSTTTYSFVYDGNGQFHTV
jgi:hypothetical protein